MVDVRTLSTEDLLRLRQNASRPAPARSPLAGSVEAPAGPASPAGADVSKMSDDELLARKAEADRQRQAGQRVEQGFETIEQAPAAPADLVQEVAQRAPGRDVRFNPNMVDAFASGMAQALSVGLSDEAIARLKTGWGLWGDLDQATEDVQAEMEAARNKYPWLFFGGELAGAVTGGTGLAKSGLSLTARAANRGRLARTGAAATEGAGAGAAYGFGTGEGGLEDRAQRARTGAAVGAVAGPVGEKVVDVGGRVVRRVIGRKPGTAATRAAGEFDIPLTRGQATGDVGQQAFEEAARNEAKGATAGRIMREFDERQGEAITGAAERIAQELNPQSLARLETPSQAGEIVRDAVQDRVSTMRSASREAYREAADRNADVMAVALQELPGTVRNSLGMLNEVIDPALTPAANRARTILEDFARSAPDNAVGVSVKGLERVRQTLNKISASATSPTDREALRSVKKGFDEWLENAVDNALFSGDRAVLDDLRKGRGLASQYLRITSPKSGDDAGRILRKFAEDDIDAVEATNWLLGSAIIGAPGRPVRVVKRIADTFGRDSEPFQSLRQAAWLRLTQSPRGGKQPGAAEITRRIDEFLTGRGSSLAKALYTGPERAQMQRFSKALRSVVADARATNPSKSGFAATRLLSSVGDNLAAALGFMQGGLDMGIATKLALPLFRGGAGAARARTAVTSPVPPARTPGGTIAGAGQGADLIPVFEDERQPVPAR